MLSKITRQHSERLIVYFKEAIICLKAHRLRSFLALIGLLIGTASVVALITIGILAKQAAIDQFKNLGTKKMVLHINSDDKQDLLTISDLLIKHDYQNYLSKTQQIFNNQIIAQVHPVATMFKTIYFDNSKINSYQLGVNKELQSSLKLNIQTGRLLNEHDLQRNYVVLGNAIQQKFLAEHNITLKVNDHLNIDNYDFTIIGILEHWPVDPLFTYDVNHSMLIPLSTVQYISNNYAINELYFDLNSSATPIEAENYLTSFFNVLIPNANLQFSNAEQILLQLEQQAQILTILLGAIGTISLLVGAIGVMNIMLVAVVERKAEIGIRMAIGATPKEIKLQFLFETICLSSLGGLLGTLIGILIPYLVTIFAGWNFTLQLPSIAVGLIISLGVGLFAGYYPARQASQMLPVDCLQN